MHTPTSSHNAKWPQPIQKTFHTSTPHIHDPPPPFPPPQKKPKKTRRRAPTEESAEGAAVGRVEGVRRPHGAVLAAQQLPLLPPAAPRAGVLQVGRAHPPGVCEVMGCVKGEFGGGGVLFYFILLFLKFIYLLGGGFGGLDLCGAPPRHATRRPRRQARQAGTPQAGRPRRPANTYLRASQYPRSKSQSTVPAWDGGRRDHQAGT